MPENIPVKSIQIMFNIIETVADRDGAKLSEELDIPKSTVHDHITSLYRIGSKDDEMYTGLGSKPSMLALKFRITWRYTTLWPRTKEPLRLH